MKTKAPPHVVTVVTVDDRRTHALADLTALTVECEHLYPGIDVWFNRKVMPGLISGSRVGYVAYSGSDLVGAAILRRGENAKLCSLRIRDDYAGNGFGTGLFHLAVLEASRCSSTLHFTAPEELARSEQSFFEGMGFKEVARVERRYRNGQGEYAFVGQTNTVLERTVDIVQPTLFGAEVGATASERRWMIMSIHPKYADLILRGKKTIEIRRRFSACHVGMYILIYSTQPTKAVVGSARIVAASRIKGDGGDLAVCSAACVTTEDLKRYAEGVNDVWAIQLSEVTPLQRPMELQDLSRMLQTKVRPPVSFEIVRRGSSWGRIADHLALTRGLQSDAGGSC